MASEPVPHIAGYHIERELGRGGMAVVYLAAQELLERPVALKVLHAAQAQDAAWRARFLREGRSVAKLNHRHVVTIYDLGISDGLPYIAMEYLPAGDLKQRVGQGELRQRLHIISQLAQALACAHQQHLVHRDIKPQNVLFRTAGEAVLTDFGIAKQEGDASLTSAGMVVGTAAYLSPEQARGFTLDGRSDLYSLGVVLYELLTGSPLFTAATELGLIVQHLTSAPPPLPAALNHLQPLLNRLLAKDPDARYPSAEALLAELQPWLMETQPSPMRSIHKSADVPANDDDPELGHGEWVRLRAAAVGGAVEAQRILGLAYFNGQGITQDYARARQWLQQAAAQHDAEALYALAQFFEHGLGGTRQSDTQALHCYREAAEHGCYAAYADMERLSGTSF